MGSILPYLRRAREVRSLSWLSRVHVDIDTSDDCHYIGLKFCFAILSLLFIIPYGNATALQIVASKLRLRILTRSFSGNGARWCSIQTSGRTTEVSLPKTILMQTYSLQQSTISTKRNMNCLDVSLLTYVS